MASGLGMEETELRLGLPGGCGEEAEAVKILGKRGFKQTLDLKLQLHTPAVTMKDEAQAAAEEEEEEAEKPEKPPAPKAQVVGWPPVRSFRRNMISAQSEKGTKEGGGGNKSGIHSSNSAATTSFVKVSMAGAPYLRKVDLKTYRSYGELSVALQNMFLAFTTGNDLSEKDNTKVMNLINGSEYMTTYEDKDEDWMLVGDVPWEMFVDSCKRLRIMKGSEASGLAPRAMDKSKDRS